MTESKPEREHANDPATIDRATGLLSQDGFRPLAEHRFRLSDRTREPVTLVFVRPTPSDASGSASGTDPDLLVEIAGVMRDATREADLTARLGGEAFCVLLAGDASGAEATVLSRIVQGLAERNARSERPAPLSLSIGTASYEPGSRRSIDAVLAEASERMHTRGRNGEPPR